MEQVGRIVANVARRVLDFALPPRCPGCGAVTLDPHDFCLGCWAKLEFLGEPCCATCSEPFERAAGPGALCGKCLQSPPAFDRMRAFVAYGEIPRRLVLRLKYARRPSLAETAALRMVSLLPNDPDVLIVPVPLHRWRLWARGYNQSALIAAALGRLAGRAVAVDLLERRRATPVLRGLGPRQRQRAVKGAFRTAPSARGRVRGAHVVLIDDVYTTGATANACATTLRRAGAARIELLCWARVVRDPAADVDKRALEQQLQGLTNG